MACNVCDDSLHRELLDGNLDRIPSGQPTDGSLNCATCGARPRQKTFRLVFDEHIAPRLVGEPAELRALQIAGNTSTHDVLADRFGSVVDAAIAGRALKTDVRDLKEFDADSLDLLSAVGVLDFVTELDEALGAARRVLRRGGTLLLHLMPYRLRDDADGPRVSSYVTLESVGGGRDETSLVPDITVGRQWLMNRLAANGFHAEMYDYVDPFSGYTTPWFLGRKLSRALVDPGGASR